MSASSAAPYAPCVACDEAASGGRYKRPSASSSSSAFSRKLVEDNKKFTESDRGAREESGDRTGKPREEYLPVRDGLQTPLSMSASPYPHEPPASSRGAIPNVREFSATRLNYDKGAYKHQLLQSVGPGRYFIETPTQECDACFPQDPRMALTKGSTAKCVDVPLIDIDSELQGISRMATKDPTKRFMPDGKRAPKDKGERRPLHECELRAPPACRDYHVVSEDTRLSNPPCTLRGEHNGFNRWEALCRNPQVHTERPFDTLVNNRLLVKDTHRPALPQPIDQTSILPPHSRDDAMLTTMPAQFSSDSPPSGLSEMQRGMQQQPDAPNVYPSASWGSCDNIYH